MPNIDHRPSSYTPGIVMVRFTEDELAEILRAHCVAAGIELPNGKTVVWGVDSNRDNHCVTLAAYEPEPQA